MLRTLSCTVFLLSSLASSVALASADFECSPTWKLAVNRLDSCSNLPFLSPGNDSRANLKLMLSDSGLLTLPNPLSTSQTDQGYAQVPFSLEMLRDPNEEESADEEDLSAVKRENLAITLNDAGVPLTDDALTEQSFAYGEGNRCRSNNFSNANIFVSQLLQENLNKAELQHLAQARVNLLALCTSDQPAASVIDKSSLSSELAISFANYLEAAQAFYQGNFAQAQQQFTELAKSPQAWLAETARYMQARTALNQAQVDIIDEYGYADLDKADQNKLAQAEQLFNEYLTQYPQGLYARSTQGLLRRVYWLNHNSSAYAQALAKEFSKLKPEDNQHTNELIDELENKGIGNLNVDQIKDPQILTLLDLMRLRDTGEQAPKLSIEQLNNQKEYFNKNPQLHNYLLAAWNFYVAKDAAQALILLPESQETGPLNLLAFSQQTLRGLALESQDQAVALTHWEKLLKRSLFPLQHEQIALAWALNQARQGQLDAIFSSSSPFTSEPARIVLLKNQAGPELLRKQVQDTQNNITERDPALDTLLSKELLFGRFVEFLADQPLVKTLPQEPSANQSQRFTWPGNNEGYPCPNINEVARALQQDPNNPSASLCLGEFVRQNNLDSARLNNHPPADELGGAPSQFTGTQFSRLKAYQAIIANTNAKADDRAYALYRAAYCFAPANYNTCDDQEISESQRKQWFNTLKKQYGKSVWAQNLKYYW